MRKIIVGFMLLASSPCFADDAPRPPSRDDLVIRILSGQRESALNQLTACTADLTMARGELETLKTMARDELEKLKIKAPEPKPKK